MPLPKSSSEKSFKESIIAELGWLSKFFSVEPYSLALTVLFLVSFANMLNGVTVRAQDFDVLSAAVVAISILVMQYKGVNNVGPRASFAGLKQSTPLVPHAQTLRTSGLSGLRKHPIGLAVDGAEPFLLTFNPRWRLLHWIATLGAVDRDAANPVHGSVVAFPRAILGSNHSRSDCRELRAADGAWRSEGIYPAPCHARPRAELGSFTLVRSHLIIAAALSAFNCDHGGCYAPS